MDQEQTAARLAETLRERARRIRNWIDRVGRNYPASHDVRCAELFESVADLVQQQDAALTALEAERNELHRKLEREGADRCAAHPDEVLYLVCAECFESEKTAAANRRTKRAEAALTALKAERDKVESDGMREVSFWERKAATAEAALTACAGLVEQWRAREQKLRNRADRTEVVHHRLCAHGLVERIAECADELSALLAAQGAERTRVTTNEADTRIGEASEATTALLPQGPTEKA